MRSFEKGARVVAYLRDSGGDEQDLSVPQQEAEIRKFCSENGLVLTRIFKDIASPGSSTVGRTAFREMVAYFRDGASEAGLVLWRASRFARDFDDSQYYKADIRRRGYQIHFIKDDIPEGLDGRLYEALLDWMNQKFLEDMSVDVKRGLRNLVKNYGAVPGTPPRGFMRERIEIGIKRSGKPRIAHKWVPKPGEFELVKEAWKMRLAGANHSEIQKATKLYGSKNSYTTFFRNPIYKGELHYAGMVIENYCEAAVTVEDWERVQKEMRTFSLSNSGRPDHINRANSSYLFTGLVRCARCQGAVNGDTIYRHGKVYWQYYTCSRARRNAGCDGKRIPLRSFEDAIWKLIVDKVLSPENLEIVQDDYIRRYATLEKDVKPLLNRLRGQLGYVRQQINNVVDSLTELGKSTALTDRLRELELQEFKLEMEIARAENQLTLPPVKQDVQKISHIMRNVLEQSDVKQKRVILRGFISTLLVDRVDNEVIIELEYIPPILDHELYGKVNDAAELLEGETFLLSKDSSVLKGLNNERISYQIDRNGTRGNQKTG